MHCRQNDVRKRENSFAHPVQLCNPRFAEFAVTQMEINFDVATLMFARNTVRNEHTAPFVGKINK